MLGTRVMESDVLDGDPHLLSSKENDVNKPWGSYGVLNARLRKPIYEDRKNDVAISTSREIPGKFMADKRRWVYKFLDHYKCFDGYDEYSDLVKAMKISGNKFKDHSNCLSKGRTGFGAGKETYVCSRSSWEFCWSDSIVLLSLERGVHFCLYFLGPLFN